MTAVQFLDRARALDADIQRQDRLLLIAQTYEADPRIIARIVATRNRLVADWASCWNTRKVTL